MSSEVSTLSKLAPTWKTLLSAALVAAALPPWDFSFLIWVALVPWLTETRRARSYGAALLQGLWLAAGIAVLSAYWLSFAVHDFLTVSWPTSIAAVAAFAVFGAQPQFVAFAALIRWAEPRFEQQPSGAFSLGLCLCLALCYAGMDWALPRLFDVGLGYALHSAENLRQLADVGGVSLLTFGIVAVNLLASRSLYPKSNRRLHAGVAALLVVSAFAYGVVRNREVARIVANPSQKVHVGVVQGSVANETRLAWARGDERAAERQLSTYMLLTEPYIGERPRPDFVVWPEATFPGVFLKPATKYQQGRGIKFDRQVLRLNVPIVFGGYDMTAESDAALGEHDPTEPARRTLFNSLFAIVPDYARPGSQGSVQRYHKHELLPFAETLPGAAHIDWIREALPTLGFFGAGEGARVFVLTLADGSTVRAAPIICSESLYPSTIIESAKRNSQLLLNIGSDGWFGNYGAPEFHLAISKFRSIETRLPQVRSANSGISALILPSGEIAASTKWGEERTFDLEVPLSEPVPSGERTLMLEWGDWFGRQALIAGAAMLFGLGWFSRRQVG